MVRAMISLEAAQSQLLALVRPLPAEIVSLIDATGRWDAFERFCAHIAGRDDVLYCTNREALLGMPPPQTVFVKCLLTAIIKIACGVVKFQMAKL